MTVQRKAPTRNTVRRELAEAINRAHLSRLAADRDSLAHAVRAGELLQQAKGQLRHGEWAEWVAEHCRFTTRTAQLYMQVYRYVQANAHAISHLTYSEVVALVRRPMVEEPPPYSLVPPPRIVLGFERQGDREQFYDLVRACGGLVSDPLPTLVSALERMAGARQEAAA
jgi:hypothetical protein